MPTALTWAFEQTESLIILEDDILPSQSFSEFFLKCSRLFCTFTKREDDFEII